MSNTTQDMSTTDAMSAWVGLYGLETVLKAAELVTVLPDHIFSVGAEALYEHFATPLAEDGDPATYLRTGIEAAAAALRADCALHAGEETALNGDGSNAFILTALTIALVITVGITEADEAEAV